MATFERQIDALGGAPLSGSDYDQAHHDGHSSALDAVTPIAADADQVTGAPAGGAGGRTSDERSTAPLRLPPSGALVIRPPLP